MKNKVLIIGGDHHNTLGVVESFAEKGIKPYVLIYEKNTHSFVLRSKHIADAHHGKKRPRPGKGQPVLFPQQADHNAA